MFFGKTVLNQEECPFIDEKSDEFKVLTNFIRKYYLENDQ
jgi:hypothetical protein